MSRLAAARAAASAAQPLTPLTRPAVITLARQAVSQRPVWAAENRPQVETGRTPWAVSDLVTARRDQVRQAWISPVLIGCVVGARRRFTECSEVQVRMFSAGRTHLIGIKGIKSQPYWEALSAWESAAAAEEIPICLLRLAWLANHELAISSADPLPFAALAKGGKISEALEASLAPETAWPSLLAQAARAEDWIASWEGGENEG